ncbi:hypothetical protein MAPG_06006, partial [Magnaporthiopsis poae ATCC 64411]
MNNRTSALSLASRPQLLPIPLPHLPLFLLPITKHPSKMKLYTSRDPAPNPRRVRLFAAEKGIALDEVMLDLLKLEHKSAAHVARNSLGQVPVLEVDEGGGKKTYLTETVAICRYLDALHPDKERTVRAHSIEHAKVDMWIRR